MIDLNKNQTLEQIEDDYWEDITYPTGLIQKCYELRKKRLNDLEVNDLRLLIGQNIGLEILIPIAVGFLQDNVLAEGDFYPGDLLRSVLDIDCDFWKKHQNSWSEVKKIFDIGSENIQNDSNINKSIKEDIFQCYQRFNNCMNI